MLIANSSGGADPPPRHASHYGALPYRGRRINFYACLARACAVTRVRLPGLLVRRPRYPEEFSNV
jgi:hypothetical protein